MKARTGALTKGAGRTTSRTAKASRRCETGASTPATSETASSTARARRSGRAATSTKATGSRARSKGRCARVTQGTFTWANRERYSGFWRRGKKHGKGEFRFANGNEYEGDFCEDVIEGFGRCARLTRLKLASGVVYLGEFRQGVQHGRGQIVVPEDPANPIKGQWNMGEMLGSG